MLLCREVETRFKRDFISILKEAKKEKLSLLKENDEREKYYIKFLNDFIEEIEKRNNLFSEELKNDIINHRINSYKLFLEDKNNYYFLIEYELFLEIRTYFNYLYKVYNNYKIIN